MAQGKNKIGTKKKPKKEAPKKKLVGKCEINI
jgi:hypothetical protein